MSLRCFPVCLSVLLLAFPTYGQEFSTDTAKARTISILPVPTLGFTPETRFYAGAVVQAAYRLHADTRLSAAKLDVSFTANRQTIFMCEWDHFFRHEAAIIRGQVYLSRYPDYYWGNGRNTADSNRIRYTSDRAYMFSQTLIALGARRFVGLDLRYHSQQRFVYMEGDTSRFNSLIGNALGGLGLVFLQDRRNNQLNATKGDLVRVQSDYNSTRNGITFLRHALDTRKYWSDSMQSFGLRFFMQATDRGVPFFDLPLYGGDAARGYFTGRFRGEMLYTLQTEYRKTLWRRWGVSLFGGIGESRMWDDGATLKPMLNGGLGIRFMADREARVNLRMDMAWGAAGQNGFYIAFGEAF
jgi:hypothetical protein